MTPEELQLAIEANTQAINFLVTQFIRPSAQQHQQSEQRLERIERLLERQVEVITGIELRLETVATQQQANAQQIAQNAEASTRFDARLEETRQLVAENASGIAQLTVKQENNATAIAQLTVKQENNASGIEELKETQQANASQIEAIAELTRTQLAGIIGNGRRIDRLEQQAS